MDVIAVLGTGRMGAGLSRSFVRAGREVFVGSRDPARAEELAAGLRQEHPGAAVRAGTYAEAAQAGRMVVLPIPYPEAAGVLKLLRPLLERKIVVDITNPFGAAPEGLSAAEVHAPLLPPSASLVAAWKTTYFKWLEPEVRAGQLHDVFVCGEDEWSKREVMDLVRATDFRPLDCGGLESCRVLDAMVPLLFEVARRNGSLELFAWKFLP